jgi:outer membrane receptor for ferrienterochelin and colicin
MYRKLLLVSLIVYSVTGFAQRPDHHGNQGKGITGAITGQLTDSISGEGIPFGSIGLQDQINGKVVNGTVSDEKGNFRISDVSSGLYTLQVLYVGYAPREVKDIRLTPQKPDFDCGDIILSPAAQLLEEIKVVGEGPLVEARPDRIVYNAERDITTRGGDAADVLRNVPLLSVDFDGNVSLRGSENVRILINGRPSGIFNASVADALKMMPADQIKSVEVITAPSAKYDGEGTAGIINIITKKKNIEGLAGTADLTAGTRSNRANMNLNYGRGRLGINASGGGHYNWPVEGTTTFRREEFGASSPSLLTQDGTNTADRLGYRLNAGLQYDLNSLSSINSSFSYRGHRVNNENDVLSSYSYDSLLDEVYRRTTDGHTNRSGWDLEGAYEKKFEKEDQEWSFSFELDKDDDFSAFDYLLRYTVPENIPDALENNDDVGDNLELTLQTDYAHPVSERIILETGVKGTLRNIESDFRYTIFDPDKLEWVVDPARTDIFYYTQDIFAGYLSSTVKVDDKITVIAGLRAELTDIGGEFEHFDSPFDNNYFSLLPNVTVSKKVGDFNQVKISYNQRIQRPNQRHVNPFVEYNDERDISYGNPELGPERVQQLEVGTNVFINKSMINVAVFGRKTDDLIESLLKITDEGVSETTFENFGVRYAFGINAFGSVSVGEKFTIRGGFDMNVWSSEGMFEGEDLSGSGVDYNGRITLTYALSETLKMEGFSFFRSPSYTVQGKNPNWVMSSFAVKQELFKKKLTLGLSIFQPFSENLTQEREISGDDFYQNNTTIRPVRSIGINIGYRFGKLDANERSGKKKNQDSDFKEDGGDRENQF